MPDPLTGTSARWGWLWSRVLLPLIATRVAILLVAMIAITSMNLGPNPTFNAKSFGWLQPWARWDACWYVTVAREGYSYHPGEYSNVAFAPLYPLLLRVTHETLLMDDDSVDRKTPSSSWFLAGLLISNGALVIAVSYLYFLVRLDYDDDVAERTVWYLLIFPTTIFLSGVYAESTFLAAAIPSFYYARRGDWWRAGILGALATLARPHGVLMVVPLAWEYVAQRGFRWRGIRFDVLSLLLMPLALAGLFVHLYYAVGDPWASLKIQSVWRRELVFPWRTFQNFFSHSMQPHGSPGHDYSPIDFAFTLFCFFLTIATWKALRPSYAILCTLFFLMMVSTSRLLTNPRYAVAMFPMFIVLAAAGQRQGIDRFWSVSSAMLAALFTTMFALSYWMA